MNAYKALWVHCVYEVTADMWFGANGVAIFKAILYEAYSGRRDNTFHLMYKQD